MNEKEIKALFTPPMPLALRGQAQVHERERNLCLWRPSHTSRLSRLAHD